MFEFIDDFNLSSVELFRAISGSIAANIDVKLDYYT